ncbi:hypothetical protein B0H12DRAFT_475238 [Mycena haematopus]|nr:hypothetical protein B0H12DRAFT_475238 [Mycena haematopus]
MDRVPAEVWLEIFSTLKRRHLMSLHRVSRFFHRISRPLVFKHFAFHPYAIDDDIPDTGQLTHYLLIPDEVAIRRTIRRLRFWASADVAPLVKECTVSPWDIEDALYVSCPGGDMLLCAFFELLPRFMNLRKLSFFYVKFKQLFIDAIFSLPSLKEIQLGKFLMDEVVTTDLHLKAASISFSNVEDLLGVQKWLSTTDPQMLTQLSLLPSRAARVSLDVGTVVFPQVETLEIRISPLARDIVALHRFPAVRRLRIFIPYAVRLGTPTASLFPLLDTYCGPPELLVLLDSRATPRRLEIVQCRPKRTLQIMQSCAHTLCNVTSLSLTFYCLQTKAFRPIVESFPALVDFRMEVKGSQVGDKTYTAQSLYLKLAELSPFPRGIETIAIVWPTDTGPRGQEVIPAARLAWAALATAHPSLQWAHFAWPGARCRSSRKWNGEFHEQCNTQFGTPSILDCE